MSRRERMVSIHVQLRWLERFRGFNLDHIRAEMQAAKWNGSDEHNMYNYLRTRRGINFTEIIDEICSPQVAHCIRLGVASIPLDGDFKGFTLKVVYPKDRDPKIVTVLHNMGRYRKTRSYVRV